jgi:hypothetical protein
MNTLPQQSQKSKINISMMLNVPLNIEIEILPSSPISKYHPEEQIEEIILDQTLRNSESKVIVNEVNIAQLEEYPLKEQIINQIEQIVSTDSVLSSNQYKKQVQNNSQFDVVRQDKLLGLLSTGKSQDISSQILPHKNKNALGFLDSFNDSFAFMANTVGKILFLGKIVNYSWD